MSKEFFYEILNEKFKFEPTVSQIEVFEKIAYFLSKTSDNSILLIKGYAGTGKTEVIGHLVQTIRSYSKKISIDGPDGEGCQSTVGLCW